MHYSGTAVHFMNKLCRLLFIVVQFGFIYALLVSGVTLILIFQAYLLFGYVLLLVFVLCLSVCTILKLMHVWMERMADMFTHIENMQHVVT